jgi:myo-inositol-1(or 4)-monophosphatase
MLQSALINVMVKAARRAGRSLKRDLGEIENLQVSLKGPANFVSLADKRAEEMLLTDLTKARPGYGFIGEEGGVRIGDDKTHTWIVDPLDGTTNFLHGIPQFAISIGLQREGTLIAGVIYNPANDELYTAERGKGAFLNDQRLRVAGRPPRRLLGTQFAALGHGSRPDHHPRSRRHGERDRRRRRSAEERQRDLRQRVHSCRAGEDSEAAGEVTATSPSSSAKADDPVRRAADCLAVLSRNTGCPPSRA